MNVYIEFVLVLITINVHVPAPCMSHFGVTYGLGVCHACQDYMQFTALEQLLSVFSFAYP